MMSIMSYRSSLAAACIALATLSHFPSQATATASTSSSTTTTTPTQCEGVISSSSSSSFSSLTRRHNGDNNNNNNDQPSAQAIVAALNLTTNVEGGYYVETFRDATLLPDGNNNRSVSTAIYYLLEGPGPASVWHRVDAAEVWHWYAGAPMVLELSADDGSPTRRRVLGPDVLAADGQRPQLVIPAYEWQRAVSCGDWTLVGTTVAPAFVPEGYELAPDGWEPNGA